ncbi:MAG TPA: hypothetical protein VMU81_17395 [Acetobacteraceae bacterium]|nr:hypothetical protein [Acetobacteraceae bacterium]
MSCLRQPLSAAWCILQGFALDMGLVALRVFPLRVFSLRVFPLRVFPLRVLPRGVSRQCLVSLHVRLGPAG